VLIGPLRVRAAWSSVASLLGPRIALSAGVVRRSVATTGALDESARGRLAAVTRLGPLSFDRSAVERRERVAGQGHRGTTEEGGDEHRGKQASCRTSQGPHHISAESLHPVSVRSRRVPM